MFAGILILIFYFLKGFSMLLYWVAPVLLIATLIINYRVVADYALSIFDTLQNNLLLGILKVVFTVFCYPFVIGWLFVKALFYKKMDTIKKQFEQPLNQKNADQFTTYEEVSSQMTETEPKKPFILDLPKPKEKEKNNPYDNLFGED